MISFFTGSGGAGIIRGEQIAKRLGASLNPTGSVKVNDVCIYVKREPPKDYPKHTLVDVVEDSAGLRWVKSHPKVGVIASSESIYSYLSEKLKNKIIYIPQHHCNFENFKRTRKEVRVVGVIGNKATLQHSLDNLEQELNIIGLDLKTLIKQRFSSREEVVEFYREIDIQLIYRPKSDGVLRNPLKLVNACSFGIPTVAYPEECFEELSSCYIKAYSISDMLLSVGRLRKQKELYESFVRQGLEQSDRYHIDNVIKYFYNNLKWRILQ